MTMFHTPHGRFSSMSGFLRGSTAAPRNSRRSQSARPLSVEVLEERTLLTVLATAIYQGHTYDVLSRQSWQSSEAEAISLGGHLVTIDNQAENNFVRDFARPYITLPYTGAWIGLNDAAVEGQFTWIADGSPLSSFHPWNPGEPNNLNNNQDFVMIYVGPGTWDDAANVDPQAGGAVVEIAGSDLAATSLAWNTAQGGVDYGYTISGADLPKATTAALYWSTDTNFNTGQHARIDNSVITTQTVARTDPYTGHISAADLGRPPTDAPYKYLLFVVNPDSSVTESDGPNLSDPNSDNVKSVPISLPDLAMQKAKELSQNSVAVDYAINNAAVTQALQFDVYQSATAPPVGAPFVPGTNDVLVGSATLAASDSADLVMGSHTGVALTLSSPLKSDPTHPYVVVVGNPSGANHFTESDNANDTNNTAYFELPDIRLNDVTTYNASDAVIFRDFQVDYSISNSASPAFVLRAYLAPGPMFDPAQDQMLGQSGVSSPDMRQPNDDGSAKSYTTVLQLNQLANVSADHYIIIVADPDGAIGETSKTNNDLFAVPIIDNGDKIDRVGEEGSSGVPEQGSNASGPYKGAILPESPEYSQFQSLVTAWQPSPLFQFFDNYDTSVLTPSQIAQKKVEERIGQGSLLPPLENLVNLVLLDINRNPDLWNGITFSINAAYDSTGSHARGSSSGASLHYEGRALDIQDIGGDLSTRSDRLGRLAGLAWLSGFDWSYVEPKNGVANHLHVSTQASLQPNILAPIGNQSVVQGTTLQVLATVPDQSIALDSLVFSLIPGGAPSGAEINPNTGEIVWVPRVSPGIYTMSVRVDDLSVSGLFSTRTFSVTVTPFVSGFGARPDAFVTTLYNEVLGRAPEPSGLFFWSKQLASKVTPRTVATAFLASRERQILQSQHRAPPISFGRALGDANKAWKQAIKVNASHPTLSVRARPAPGRLVEAGHR